MQVNKIEFIGEVCDCDEDPKRLISCRTGFKIGGISSRHPGKDMYHLDLWVDRDKFREIETPKKCGVDLPPGKYRITIEKIEDTDAG